MRRIIPFVPLLIALALPWAAPAAAQQLFWLDTRYASPTIHRCNPDGSATVSAALPPGTLPEGLALDPVQVHLYWSEAAWSGARVRSSYFNFGSQSTVLGGASVLRGLAVDELGRRLYWSTSNLATGAGLWRSYLDGTGAQRIVALGGASNPRGVALDLPTNKVYWTDLDQNTISWANLDGTGAAIWLEAGAGAAPWGIAVDAQNQFVYWTEYGTGRILRAPAGGGGPVTVLETGLGNPTYLALDVAGNHVFWSEAAAGAQKIQRAALTGGAITNLGQPAATYGGLAFATAAALGAPAVAPEVRVSSLSAVSPNPARGTARLDYALARETPVRLSVLDVQGREVAVLATGVQSAGSHTATWTAPAPGVYFVRLAAEGRLWKQRFAVVR